MQKNWERAVALLLESEGAEVNVNPPGTPVGQGEPGGASRYGVSVAALSDHRARRGLGPATVAMVAGLSAADAGLFYRDVTGAACRFNDLPGGVDYAMLDVTANLGPAGGAWLLQCVLGLWPHVDRVTDEMISLIRTINSGFLAYAIGAAWIAKKRESPTWPKHGHGWNNRMTRVRGDALMMIGV